MPVASWTQPKGMQSNMARRTRCPNCQTPLKVPEDAGPKRLKCPKCATKFHPEPTDDAGPARRPTSSAALPGLPEANLASSQSNPAIVDDDLILPGGGRDLRESFDLPLLADDDPPGPAQVTSPSGLLNDEPKRRPRKPSGGDARREARRCTCGAVVPAGMSLCSRCGLDLDTGTRINVDELLEETVAPPSMPGAPLGVLFLGTTTMLVSGLLGLVSLGVYALGRGGDFGWGYLLLAPVCGFGIYASIRFLQGKTSRLLLITLLLGAGIDLVTMVLLPLILAAEPTNSPTPGHEVAKAAEPEVDLGPYITPKVDAFADDDTPVIDPFGSRVNWRQVYAGLIILFVVTAAIIYANSYPVKRYFERRRLAALPSLGQDYS